MNVSWTVNTPLTCTPELDVPLLVHAWRMENKCCETICLTQNIICNTPPPGMPLGNAIVHSIVNRNNGATGA